MLLPSLLFALLIILIKFAIAKKFEQIACVKGYPDVHAFAMCFWFGIAGYLYVIALPNAHLDNKTIKFQKETIKLLNEIKNGDTANNEFFEETNQQKDD